MKLLKYNSQYAVQLHIYFHIGSNPLKVKAQSNTSHASQAPSTAAIVRQISLEEGNLSFVDVFFKKLYLWINDLMWSKFQVGIRESSRKV